MSDAVRRLALRVFSQVDLAACNGCHECGLRCTAGVAMSREEYRAVKEYASDPVHSARVEAVVSQDKAIDLGDGCTVHACRFYDMGGTGCAVYPARPLVCRLLGHVEWMPCPIARVERKADTADALALMQAYAEQERRTWEAWEEYDGFDRQASG